MAKLQFTEFQTTASSAVPTMLLQTASKDT